MVQLKRWNCRPHERRSQYSSVTGRKCCTIRTLMTSQCKRVSLISASSCLYDRKSYRPTTDLPFFRNTQVIFYRGRSKTIADQGNGRGFTPISNTGFEPLTRVTPNLTDNNNGDLVAAAYLILSLRLEFTLLQEQRNLPSHRMAK